jgi:hypothetical protein
MRRREPLVIRPWLLPPLVLALIVPAVAGFMLAGPPLGLAIGALEVTALVILAARARFDEPIEVASDSGEYRLLVLALAAVEEPGQAGRIAEIAHAAAAAAGDPDPDVLVVTPATGDALARWLSDLEDARFDAQRRLALSIGTLAAAGLRARGRVGDPDAVQAVEDELRTFPASELVLVTGPDPPEAALAELERRLPLPVRRLD